MKERRILGIDYGTKRIGIAISDPLGVIATPLVTVYTSQVRGEIGKLMEEYSIETVVIGQPIRTDGELGKRAEEVHRFAEFMKKTFSVEVELWDERYSSQEAERYMREMEEKPSRNKGKVDRIAATLILQAYLDSKNNGRND